jgi:gag-polypeptide of LTR copia-type
MLNTISQNKCKLVCHLAIAKEVWDTLCMYHKKQGPLAQLILIKQALDIHFTTITPFSETINKIDNLTTHIKNMGNFD